MRIAAARHSRAPRHLRATRLPSSLQVFLRLYDSDGWVEGTPSGELSSRAYVAPANSSEYLGSMMANACIMDGGEGAMVGCGAERAGSCRAQGPSGARRRRLPAPLRAPAAPGLPAISASAPHPLRCSARGNRGWRAEPGRVLPHLPGLDGGDGAELVRGGARRWVNPTNSGHMRALTQGPAVAIYPAPPSTAMSGTTATPPTGRLAASEAQGAGSSHAAPSFMG